MSAEFCSINCIRPVACCSNAWFKLYECKIVSSKCRFFWVCGYLLADVSVTWLFECSQKTVIRRLLHSWYFRRGPTTSTWSRCVDKPLPSSWERQSMLCRKTLAIGFLKSVCGKLILLYFVLKQSLTHSLSLCVYYGIFFLVFFLFTIASFTYSCQIWSLILFGLSLGLKASVMHSKPNL